MQENKSANAIKTTDNRFLRTVIENSPLMINTPEKVHIILYSGVLKLMNNKFFSENY